MRQLYLSKQGIRHRLDGPISDCKSVDVLPRDYYLNSRKFGLIFRNSNWSLVEESIACRKEPLENGL